MNDRALQLVQELQLEPHPEGGHFREVSRSRVRVHRGADERSALTTIYFLLQRGEHSRWHVVSSDEAWHFYEGDPLELVLFDPDESNPKPRRLGPGHAHVEVVPAGWWQAARSLGDYSLVGCTVGPGFEFDDFSFVADLSETPARLDALGNYRRLL